MASLPNIGQHQNSNKGRTDETLNCQFCNEELTFPTSFKFRLRPSKRMSKKSLKLYHNPKLQLQASSTFNNHHSSFQKYIHRQSFPKNTVEIKCGSCSLSSSMSVLKPKYDPTPVSVNLSSSAVISSEKRKKRKKKSRGIHDLNAGLIIPSSILSSTNPLSIEPPSLPSATPEIQVHHRAQSVLFTMPSNNTSSEPSPNSKLIPQQDNKYISQRMRNKRVKRLKEDEEKNKQKEINQLRKTLFKSMKVRSLSSTSLNRFLD